MDGRKNNWKGIEKEKKKLVTTIVTWRIKTAETTKWKWVDGARLSGQETVIT